MDDDIKKEFARLNKKIDNLPSDLGVAMLAMLSLLVISLMHMYTINAVTHYKSPEDNITITDTLKTPEDTLIYQPEDSTLNIHNVTSLSQGHK